MPYTLPGVWPLQLLTVIYKQRIKGAVMVQAVVTVPHTPTSTQHAPRRPAEEHAAVASAIDRSCPASAARCESDRLLLRSAAGDREAFARLYQLTSARLFAVVRRSIWITSEAEDVLQEVYLKVWNGAKAYDPEQAQAMTWMMRVARNHAIDHLRRCALRRAHEFALDNQHAAGWEEATPIVEAAVDDAPRPDEWLEMQQDECRFDRLMDSLGAMQRQVVLLAFREGCTHADIAFRLGAPLGSVKSWMRRALQKMKATIDSEHSEKAGRN